MNPFLDNLIANLKAFNAKERDHLMRFAYLGVEEAYDDTKQWLSDSMLSALKPHVGEGAECVFAAMDYHLDWLHVALLAACEAVALEDGLERDLLADSTCADPSLQAVIGTQEDVDLLAVFNDGTTIDLLLIEAKGRAAFNRVQLARKLVRINRILMSSGAHARDCLRPKLMLMGPDEPKFTQCMGFARGLPDRYHVLLDQLKSHDSGIGAGDILFLKLGFPSDLKKVQRFGPKNAQDSAFTKWRVIRR